MMTKRSFVVLVSVVGLTLAAGSARAGIQASVAANTCVLDPSTAANAATYSYGVYFGSGKTGYVTLYCPVDPSVWSSQNAASMTVTYLDANGNTDTSMSYADVSVQLYSVNRSSGVASAVGGFYFISNNYAYNTTKELSIVPGPTSLNTSTYAYFLKVVMYRNDSTVSEGIDSISINY